MLSSHRMMLPLRTVRRPITKTSFSYRFKSSINDAAEGSRSKGTSLLWSVWGKYTDALMARPLLVKASTASFIFFVSDSATQVIMDPTADYEIARAGSGAAFGIVATGWLHYWWGFLEAFVGKRISITQNRLGNTLAKVILDQGIGAPFYVFTYYVITNFIQELHGRPQDGESKKSAKSILKETCNRAAEMLPPTMLRHWTLWPAVHTLNFYYSPLHHRVLVQNLVLVGWSGYLSHLNNGGLMTPKEEVEETLAIKRRETELLTTRKTQQHTRAEVNLKVEVASDEKL